MNKNEDLENKDDLILDVNQPLTSEQMVEGNTETENPRGDTLRTDLQAGADTFQPSESLQQLNDYIDKVKVKEEDKTVFEKDLDKISDQFGEFHHGMEMDLNPAKWAYASMWGALDVPFDVIGAIPGLGGIDDTWDSVTGFQNEGAKQFRAAASVIIPSIVSGGAYAKYHAARNLTGISGAAQWVGGQMAINGAIGAVSDYGEDPTNRLITHPDNFRRLSEAMPWMFGPQGWFPTVGDLADADATHPYMNRLLAGIDEGVLQGFGDLLGYAINAGKPILRNIKPLSKKSKAWKSAKQIENLDTDTRNAIVDLDTAINGSTDTNKIVELEAKKSQLLNQAAQTGSSEVTQNPAESWFKTRQKQRQIYRDKRALEKIARDPMIQQFDPDIAQKLASEKNLAGINNTPPGFSVLNAVDVDAQQAGAISRLGVPTYPYTPAQAKAMKLGKSRHVVREIAEDVKASDAYEAVQGLFRTDSGQISHRVYEIYNKIMRAGTGDDLRELLTNTKYRDSKNLIDEFGKFHEDAATYLDDAGAARAAVTALNDLMNLYLGREVTESSARVMHTLGAEISAKAGAPVQFQNLLDEDQVFKNIIDKMGVLEHEYGIAKYVSGWQQNEKKNNLRWLDKLWGQERPDEVIRVTLEEFGAKSKQLADDWAAFEKQLEVAGKKNPKLRRTLMKAYDATNGNVNTLDKLNRFTKYHLSPLGLLYNKEAADLGISGWQMNQFARGAWAVTYNNVLSGLSAMRAAVGNGVMIIGKPIAALSRASVTSVLKRDMEPLERVVYMYGSMFETASRAMDDAVQRMKKVHKDPDFMQRAARKDFVMEESNTWEILDDVHDSWHKEGDYGHNFMYGWAKFQRKIARQPWFRTGITGMSGVDAYTDTFMATFQSRLNAYDEVFTRYGKQVDPEFFAAKLKEAEELNYSKMFDKQGMLTDGAAKRASGEIALNLDDGFSKFINPALNKVPPLKTLMMFPRTSMNQIKLAMSYTPLSAIPGLGKYGDILMAGDDINKIKKVLLNHGVKNFDETPNAMAIYKNLRDEYEGRLMMGAGTTGIAWMYAMSGGIRGNGPADHNELIKLKKRGWKPNTVKIGNNWVSYKGVPIIEQFFNLMGDMAYYNSALGANMTQNALDKAMWTLTATYLNQTPLAGIEPILAMTRGDEGAFKRYIAQNFRAASFQSGAHGVIAKAITNSQKEIYNDFLGYVRNNTVFKDMSYSKIDHWTGEEIDEIDNPILRAINAINPVKVHGGNEPWRLWLLNSGFNDLSEIKKDRYGNDYSPEARELIGKFMGEEKLWKTVEKWSKNEVYNEDLNELRKFIRSGKSEAEVGQFRNQLTIYKKLRNLVNDAKKRAEERIADDPRYEHIDVLGLGKQRTKRLMSQNKIQEAAKQSRSNYKEREFLKYGVKN